MTVGAIEVYELEVDDAKRVYVGHTDGIPGEVEVTTEAEARVIARTLADAFGFKVSFPKET